MAETIPAAAPAAAPSNPVAAPTQEGPSLQDFEKLAFPDTGSSPAAQYAQTLQQQKQATPQPAAAPATVQAAPPATPAASPAPAAILPLPAESPADEVYDEDSFAKNEFGFDNMEHARAEIARLRALETGQKNGVDPNFPNPESRRLYEALKAGKYSEVKAYLDGQERVANFDTLSNEAKVKLMLQVQNPRYDEEMIQEEYELQYGVDATKFELDPLGLRKEKIRKAQKLDNDVVAANEYFTKFKTKITLPDIEASQPTADPEFATYKARTAEYSRSHDETIVPSVNALTEAELQMKISVNDPNNKMVFDIPISIDKEDLDFAKQAAANYRDFINGTYFDEQGKFLNAELVGDILRGRLLRTKYGPSIARQAVNAERARVIEERSGTAPGLNREYSAPPTNELEDLEKLVFPDFKRN